MVSKKLLSAAIAAAFISTPAFAAIDLADDSTALVFAKEAITTATAGFVTVDNTNGAADLFYVDTVIGAGVSATNHIYLRFDLTNAKFEGAVDETMITVAGSTDISVLQGGADGSTFVIFDIESGGIAQGDAVELMLETLEISTSAPVTIRYRAFDDQSDAIQGKADEDLADVSLAAISVANVLETNFTPDNAVADVATDFTEFVTDGTSTIIGTVEFALANAGALLVDGTVVTTLDELIDDAGSNVVLSGDLSFGDWDIDGLAIDPDTGALDTNTLADLGFGTYNVTVTVDGATTINPGAYSLATDYASLAGADFPVADKSGALGEITRNGTSIQVPYVTTYNEYNQRFVLVNRSNKPAPYSFSFTEEAGVTATAGTKATGTIPANETLIIPAVDVVTLAGKTRTAATITVTAQSANIDAATTTVDLTDGVTDTVVLSKN